MPRLLITGASGTLGHNVARIAGQQGWDVVGTYYTAPPQLPGEWHKLDIRDRDAVMAVMRLGQPAAIIHTAYMYRGAALWATTADGAAFVAFSRRRRQARGSSTYRAMRSSMGQATPTPRRQDPTRLPQWPAKAAAETAVSAIALGPPSLRTSLIISHEPLDPQTRLVLDLASGHRAGHLLLISIAAR